jgi:four helix bundle protein
VREAQRAVSTKDFKNKFGIALKEADETKYGWR